MSVWEVMLIIGVLICTAMICCVGIACFCAHRGEKGGSSISDNFIPLGLMSLPKQIPTITHNFDSSRIKVEESVEKPFKDFCKKKSSLKS